MIKHIVLFNWKPDTCPSTVDDIMAALAELQSKIDGIVDYCAGPCDGDEGMNQGYTHGFIMTFDTSASRDAYLPHPEHKKVVDVILPVVDSVLAFDFEA